MRESKIVPRPQTIIKLQASNVRRLNAIQIEPDGSMIVIGGKNGAGKTSVLDAIMMALAGKRRIPSRPIRDGEDSATITVETQDLVITKIVKRSAQDVLKITRKDIGNLELKGGLQNVLDHLTDGLSFDPLAFSRKKPKDQAEELRELIGLDFEDLDNRHAKAYRERTIANSRVNDAISQLQAMPFCAEVSETEPVSVSELMNELDAISLHNKKLDEEHEALSETKRNIVDAKSRIEQYQNSILEKEQEIRDLSDSILSMKSFISAEEEQISILIKSQDDREASLKTKEKKSDEDIRKKISGAEELNATIRNNETYRNQAEKISTLRLEAETIDKEVKAIAVERADRIHSALMPIDGLGFDDNGDVTYDEELLSSLCESMKLRISTAIAIAKSPDMPIMLIREGSSLDSDTRKMMSEMAAENGAQVWLECVMEESEDGAIIIEDGSIKAI